jgi:hypothetical protein
MMSRSWFSNTVSRAQIAAFAIFIYFAWQISPGLSMHFAPDDIQNLYHYWTDGPAAVLKAVVLFASPYYRPLGGLFYLPLYSLFGFEPLAWRIVCFGLLCVNF